MLNFFSIVIPVYNEEANIKKLIIEIIKLNFKNYELIIIDDASSDRTFELIENFQAKNLRIIRHKRNLGQSSSIRTGIINSMYKTIVTMDGDGQNDPKDIFKLLDIYFLNEKIKLVGGIRTKRKDSFIKKISSKIANSIRSYILDDNCKDTGCSLKIFDKDIFLSFEFFNGIHRFLPAYFKGYGFKTKFINVNHRERQFGVSKYNTLNRAIQGIKDLQMVYKHLKKKNV